MLNNQAKCKVFGFVGIDKYDIIMYLSSILVNLNKKVLLIDNSETAALTYCISIPESLNAKKEVVSYKNIDFIRNQTKENFEDRYDYILIDFGFKNHYQEIYECDNLVIVTDIQQHNMNRLLELKGYTNEAHLVIKEVDRTENIMQVKNLFCQQNINIKNCYYLRYDSVDQSNNYTLQYGKSIKVKTLSFEYKYFLKELAVSLIDINKSEYSQAFKRLKRGA